MAISNRYGVAFGLLLTNFSLTPFTIADEQSSGRQYPSVSSAEILMVANNDGAPLTARETSSSNKVVYKLDDLATPEPESKISNRDISLVGVTQLGKDIFYTPKTDTVDSYVALSLGGEQYRVKILDTYVDTDAGIQHQSAALFGQFKGKGFARFSTLDQSNLVVATIGIEDDRYRIVSDLDDTTRQIVYQMHPKKVGNHIGRTEDAAILEKNDRSQTLEHLEELHIEANMFANMKPEYIKRSGTLRKGSRKLMMISGGDLGTADIDINESQVPAELKRVLLRLSPLTGANDDLDIEVTSIAGSPTTGYQVFFRQLVDGIPLDQQGRIEIEAVTGRIRVINSLVHSIGKGSDIRPSTLDKEVAERYALDNVLQKFPDVRSTEYIVDSGRTKLRYHSFDDHLQATWEVHVGHYLAYVNATSGDTTLEDTRIRVGNTQLFTDTCRHLGTSSSQEPYCEQSNIKRVLREIAGTTGPVCYDGAGCNAVHTNIYNVISHGEGEWALGDAASCCDKAGGTDNRIGVLVNSQSAASNGTAYYDADARGMLHLPPASTYPIPNEPGYANDIIIHEFAHGMQDAVNDSLVPNNSSVHAYSFIEGTAHWQAPSFLET